MNHFDDIPSDIDYKDQSLTIRDLQRRGQRAPRRQHDQCDDSHNNVNERRIPSNISYKDQYLTVDALQRGERVSQRRSRRDEERPRLEMSSFRPRELPLDLGYKDQGLTLEEIEQGRRRHDVMSTTKSTTTANARVNSTPMVQRQQSASLSSYVPVVHATLIVDHAYSANDQENSFATNFSEENNVMSYPNASGDYPRDDEPNESHRKRRSNKKILLLGLCLALVAGAGAIFYAVARPLFQNKDNDSKRLPQSSDDAETTNNGTTNGIASTAAPSPAATVQPTIQPSPSAATIGTVVPSLATPPSVLTTTPSFAPTLLNVVTPTESPSTETPTTTTSESYGKF